MKVSKKILVVEDDKVLRDSVSLLLKNSNFEVIEACNGKEGVEEALLKHPDLILLDLIMPVMSGAEALTLIRKNTWGKKVPIIIMTNLDTTDDRLTEDVVKGMPLYYLVKSDTDIYEIVKTVNLLLH
jgi:two-component system alkaline phosphatase synthesis response regulator PhoP